MAETKIQSGSFISDGSNKELIFNSDIDRIVLENQTEMAATNSGHGFRYTWYKDLNYSAIMEYHPAADHTSAINIINDAVLHTSLLDKDARGYFVPITSGTNTTQPIYQVADTSQLIDGSVVSIYGTDQESLNGLDFAVNNIVLDTSFQMSSTLANAPGITTGSNGFLVVGSMYSENYNKSNTSGLNIINITKASSAVVTTSTIHSLEAYQTVMFSVSSAYGMIEIDELTGIVTSVTDYTFTVDIDSSSFTTFVFPIYTAFPFDQSKVFAIGSRGSQFEGLTVNEFGIPECINEENGTSSMLLIAGAAMPGGLSGDVINWTAYNDSDYL